MSTDKMLKENKKSKNIGSQIGALEKAIVLQQAVANSKDALLDRKLSILENLRDDANNELIEPKQLRQIADELELIDKLLGQDGYPPYAPSVVMKSSKNRQIISVFRKYYEDYYADGLVSGPESSEYTKWINNLKILEKAGN